MSTLIAQHIRHKNAKEKTHKRLQAACLFLLFTVNFYCVYWLFNKLPLAWCMDFYREHTTPFRYESYSVALILAVIIFFSFQSQRFLFKLFASTVLIFFCFLTAASWLYFDFYRDFIISSTLRLLPDMISGKSATGLSELVSFPYASQLLLGCVFTLFALWSLSRFIKIKTNRYLSITYLSITIIWVAFLQYRYYTDDPAGLPYYSPPTYTHPVSYFIKSFFTGKKVIEDKHIKAAEFLNKNVMDTKHPFFKKSKNSGQIASHKNVILIMLESVRSAETNHFGNASTSITPNLDRIAKQSISFTNFYANSSQTIRGEVAALCSMLDLSRGSPLARRGVNLTMDCLPKILKKNGYETLWFHGFNTTFYSRDSFHPTLGFMEMHDKEKILHKNPNTEIVGWGVSDDAMFKYALEDLLTRKQPFFAEILTLTNHFPFDSIEEPISIESPDNSAVYNQYIRSIHYTDTALGRFWNAFQESPLSNNTIAIIVADHGVWMSSAHDDIDNAYLQHEMQFRIPMLIWEKNTAPSIKKTIASQVDITPTLLNMLGINIAFDNFIGEDLFSKNRRELALMTGFGLFASRDKQAFCYPDIGKTTEGPYKLKKESKRLARPDLTCTKPIDNILHARKSPQLKTVTKDLEIYRNIIELSDIALLSGVSSQDYPSLHPLAH